MEKLEATIRAEIEESTRDYSTRYPEDSEDLAYCMYFNNFHLRLPFGGRRALLEQSGMMDLPLLDGGEKTNGQLYLDMDEVIEEVGLDLARVETLQPEAKRNIHKRRELLELAFPVYVGLRERNYTRSELNS